MESSPLKDIPRLGDITTKPQFGEIRLTADGTRRKMFDGKCWQYLCIGDPKCRIQSKSRCRAHQIPAKPITPIKPMKPKRSPHVKRIRKPFIGEMETQSNGNRRMWKGTRWHGLCRVEGCRVQAREYCKTHLEQRNSLPNTSKNQLICIFCL